MRKVSESIADTDSGLPVDLRAIAFYISNLGIFHNLQSRRSGGMHEYSCIVMMVVLLGFGSNATNANDFGDFISDGEGQGFVVHWNWKMSGGELITVGAWINADGYVYQEALFGAAGNSMGSHPTAQEFGEWANSHGFSLSGGSGAGVSPCATFLICDEQYWMQT